MSILYARCQKIDYPNIWALEKIPEITNLTFSFFISLILLSHDAKELKFQTLFLRDPDDLSSTIKLLITRNKNNAQFHRYSMKIELE